MTNYLPQTGLSFLCMILFSFLYHSAYSQTNDTQAKTLYTLKGTPRSCDANIENLFESWNKENISNADDLKLLSYKCIGKIKSVKDIEYYAHKMSQPDFPFFSTSGSSGVREGEPFREKRFTISTFNDIMNTYPEKDKELVKKGLEMELSKIKTHLLSSIKKGDRIYVIKSNYKGTPMESFVFCNPKTYNVTTDLHFQSFSF